MSVNVDGATVRYGDVAAVDDVDLSVDRGERFAVMGPSGAGKSTLLRIIAGLEALDTGRVTIDGRDATRTPPHERGVGLMFQDYALFPHLSVARNITYGLEMAGMAGTGRRRRLGEMLELVGLIGYGERTVDALSGGEQQRVALARTLAPEPSVVLLDEPLGSLDQALKDELLPEMRSIMASVGATSIYVTHDRTEAEGYADRMAIMRDGRILRVDAPEAIWTDPRTAFIAGFVGHRNVVDGRLVGRDGRTVVIMSHALDVATDGEIEGTVASCLFRDGSYDLAVDTGDAHLHLTTSRRLEPGEPVRLSLDVEGVLPLVDEV